MPSAEDHRLSEEASLVVSEQSIAVRAATHPFVRAILGTAPFTGGIASLLSDVALRRQEIRLRRFLLQVAREVEQNREDLGAKIDEDFLRTEEFAALVESILQEAAQTADTRKAHFLQRFLMSAVLRDRPDITWRDLFTQYLRQLSGVHLVILAVFYEIQGGLPGSDRLGGAQVPGKVPLECTTVHSRLPGIDRELVAVACVDLANLGLLIDWHSIRPSNQGVHVSFCLTESGRLFMRFMLGEW